MSKKEILRPITLFMSLSSIYKIRNELVPVASHPCQHYSSHSYSHFCHYSRFLNHSFSPSCRVHNRNIVALYDLPPNTELTFNYNETEVHMAAPFYVDSKLVSGNDKDYITRTTSSALTVEPIFAHDKESITPSITSALTVEPTFAANLDNHVGSPSFRPKDSFLSSPSVNKRKADSLFEDFPSSSD